MDSLSNSHPVEVEVDDALEISQIFDIISYMKGSSCIRMLAQHLGEDKFLEASTFPIHLIVGSPPLFD